MHDDSPITEYLHAWGDGDPAALEDLMALVYTELREQSRRFLRAERHVQTLNPTALVNEVYMRLVNLRKVSWDNRKPFFSFAATLMRRVIVEHARATRADKRGGFMQRVELDHNYPAEMKRVDILELELVLADLEKTDPFLSKLIELRFFTGLTEEETAEVLGTNRTHIQEQWRIGKRLLRQRLRGNND
jgi:RNA polymerase sigma factor (TIGR02999 family)